MNEITVIKLNVERQETWRYTGRLLEESPHSIMIEAFFNRDDSVFHELPLGRGDRFVEIYYNDRMYNIFEIYDRDDGPLKGWYCNVCLPAEWNQDQITYVDLALDLIVYPDGRQLTVDEEEFEALDLDPAVRAQAILALQQVRWLFERPEGFRLVL